MRSSLLFSTILLFCTFFNGLVEAQKTNAPDPFKGLDTAFARILKDWHTAGFAVAVVDKGKVVYEKGFGYRDWEKKLPVTPTTLFAIGSCSKAFTASLIGQLREKGLLNLDHPVREYLPELKFNNERMDNMITLKDMMTHRTGLSRYDYAWYLFSSESRDSILQKVRYMEPSASVREKWQYNNFMFLAQGMVTEKLTGKSWENNISENIFRPLDMTASNYSIKALEASNEASLGYGLKNDSIIHRLPYHDLYAIAPAGAINSNVIDMSAWVMTWINGGKFHGKQILPADYVKEAISAQMTLGGGLPATEFPDVYFADYGFAWFLSSYRGHYRVEHGGNIDGFSANTSFFPTDSVGIVVLCNQNNSPVPGMVRDLIADKLLHLSYKDWNTILKVMARSAEVTAKAAESAKMGSVKGNVHPLSHALTDYTGTFNNPAFGSFELKLVNDSLLAIFPQQTLLLKHWDYDIFQSFDKVPGEGYDTTSSGLKVLFNGDLQGAIGSLTMDLDPSVGKPAVFTRQLAVKSLDSAALAKYAGVYKLGPNVKITVFLRSGKTLILSVPGQPEYELLPIGEAKFSIKGLTGFTEQFNTDEQGKVTELVSIQPNGTFKIKRAQ